MSHSTVLSKENMTTTAHELNGLLDALEQDPNGNGPFIGQRVADAVRGAKFPMVWRPLVERYATLIRDDRSVVAHRLYCDMFCTVVTKKVYMVDMFYLYDPTSREESDEETRLREVHTTMATKYLVKMLTCAYECIHGRLPDRSDAVDAATRLYADLYAEAFDTTRVSERDVFSVVEKWFRHRVLHSTSTERSFENVAPGVPFLMCSHVYWLWLHLTAARVKYSESDLLTVIYALDTIIYCDHCKTHFLHHRSELFYVRKTVDEDRWFCRYDNAECLFHLHNRVNARSGSAETDMAILSEYKRFLLGGQQ